MKKYLIVFLWLLLLIPNYVFAISHDYEDVVYDIVNVEKENDKINLYLFHSADCSHCAAEREWLEEIKKDYSEYLNVYEYEVTYNEDNAKLMVKVAEKLSTSSDSMPSPFSISCSDFLSASDRKSTRLNSSH